MVQVAKLSENERRFIVVSSLNADLSVKEISRKIGLREHVVRHIKESLLRRGILQPLYKIDTYRLGYTDFRVFLSDVAEPSRVRLEFEKRAVNHERVYWMARMTGAYKYALTFLAKDPCEMIDFFAEVQPPSKGFFANRAIGIAGEWTVFSPNFLAPEIKGRESITLTARERLDVDLDEIDERLLMAMARNPGGSISSFARALGMRVNSLQYRVERLTAKRIIRGRTYLLNCERLGIQIYRVMIIERMLSLQQRQQLRAYVCGHPNVSAFLVSTGGWDYELRFESESSETLEEFCQSIIDTFGIAIASIRTSQQVNTLKRVSYPVAPA
jgi:DNA-binding Lrp family transcriptional regulator